MHVETLLTFTKWPELLRHTGGSQLSGCFSSVLAWSVYTLSTPSVRLLKSSKLHFCLLTCIEIIVLRERFFLFYRNWGEKKVKWSTRSHRVHHQRQDPTPAEESVLFPLSSFVFFEGIDPSILITVISHFSGWLQIWALGRPHNACFFSGWVSLVSSSRKAKACQSQCVLDWILSVPAARARCFGF